MKKKAICIFLALLMCMMSVVPAFADDSAETPPERSAITASFGLTHISGSTYRMWAKLNNLNQANVYARLTLYDASYNSISSIYTTSSNLLINLSKNVSLSSGTYHLRLSYTVDGRTYTVSRTYSI